MAIENYENIKLRVKTCGHAVIVLYKESGQSTGGGVVLTLMAGKILVTKCEPNCQTVVPYTDDDYNVHSDKNCRGKGFNFSPDFLLSIYFLLDRILYVLIKIA